MPRSCSVCDRRDRSEIDHALIEGQSAREIAARFDLGWQAVNRHRLNHLPAAIRRAAREALERENGPPSAVSVSRHVDGAPNANACHAPSMTESGATVARPAPSRRRGMELDPMSLGATVAPIEPASPAPAGALDLHAAIVGLQSRALTILENAERDGDAKTALVAIRETRGVLETLSRLQERTGGHAQAVPLAQSPEWVRTRGAIVAALADFPEARLAVAAALIATGAAS